MAPRTVSRRAALAFGLANVATAALIFVGVFVSLPARWWPVDLPAGALVVLELVSGGALLANARWAGAALRIAAAVALVAGLLAVTVLAMTASWLSGVYGPVGKGGALVLSLVAALVLPYVVVLPAVELLWPFAPAPGRE